VTVAPRYVLLALGAVLVLGTGVYLFIAVRAAPAQAKAPERAPARGAAEARMAAFDTEEDPTPRPPRTNPSRTSNGDAAGAVRPAAPIEREPPRGPDGEPQDPAPQKLDAIMAEANKAYDRGDLDEARVIARKVLQSWPQNVRMLRIVVSASCIAGDAAEAQAAYAQLPNPDREQMRTRCSRYGVSFTEP
jgi:hypothetical protein